MMHCSVDMNQMMVCADTLIQGNLNSRTSGIFTPSSSFPEMPEFSGGGGLCAATGPVVRSVCWGSRESGEMGVWCLMSTSTRVAPVRNQLGSHNGGVIRGCERGPPRVLGGPRLPARGRGQEHWRRGADFRIRIVSTSIPVGIWIMGARAG